MKFIISIFFITLTSFNFVETNVYICGLRGAKKYHYNESCRGLVACKSQTTKVSLKQAQGYGLTLCGWED
ncbi:hypothetical protein LNQ49_07575 [Flavobacterium sp. F-65]|uniref:Uncharacterized protein n=1 Tax=Flavobacterium pisciphilum TaxID=2893755 RepID=A0ABS8MRQ6_9FLAO|nr:hypothetical protein [Flavobacterium sp. F-65]MCC9071446.1 hypothetical protein [Flavobacterium sp. F-65]